MTKNWRIGAGLAGIGLGVALSVTAVWVAKLRNSPTQKPRMGPVVESVYGLGSVIAPRTYQLKSGVTLSLKKLFVKEGDRVKVGAPLARFDERIDTAAPFSGIITSIPFKEGEIIFPQSAVATLVSLEGLYLEVSLEQQAVLRVRKGQSAVVIFESLRGTSFSGKVASVFPRGNEFLVRIDLEKFPDGALPGMTADTAIEIGRQENALSVPVRAVSDGKVTVLRDGRRKKIPVKLGVVDGEWAEVLAGDLRVEDDLVIRSP